MHGLSQAPRLICSLTAPSGHLLGGWSGEGGAAEGPGAGARRGRPPMPAADATARAEAGTRGEVVEVAATVAEWA